MNLKQTKTKTPVMTLVNALHKSSLMRLKKIICVEFLSGIY